MGKTHLQFFFWYSCIRKSCKLLHLLTAKSTSILRLTDFSQFQTVEEELGLLVGVLKGYTCEQNGWTRCRHRPGQRNGVSLDRTFAYCRPHVVG